MDDNKTIELEYVQSANSLFHFMKEGQYLNNALINKRLVPRYCEEDISYLGLNEPNKCNIFVLEKCFCDIPLHKLAENFPLKYIEKDLDHYPGDVLNEFQNNNTHFDYYGQYAIAFSKDWCVKKNLQPVHYVNPDSDYCDSFRKALEFSLVQDDISEDISNDIISRLSFLKPLSGRMKRIDKSTKYNIEVEKNFHDEKEWRFVPNQQSIEDFRKGSVIRSSEPIKQHLEAINRDLEEEQYRDFWLRFEYDDIRYLIVPNSGARIELISTIMKLNKDAFNSVVPVELQKNILISKILVLEEIKKDW